MKPGVLAVEDRLAGRLAEEFKAHIAQASFP